MGEWVRVGVPRLSRRRKLLLLWGLDFATLGLSLWIAVWLRLGEVWPEAVWAQGWPLLLVVPVAGIALFYLLGLYRVVLRSLSRHDVTRLAQGVAVLALVVIAITYFDQDVFLPRSTPIIFAFVALAGTASLRYALRLVVRKKTPRTKVLIYGAGEGGMQLLTALDDGRTYEVAAFVDDDPTLHGRSIAGRPIVGPAQMGALVKRHGIRDALLAMPSASREQRKAVVGRLSAFPVRVKTMPSLDEMVNGFKPVTSLRDIAVDELLPRPMVKPAMELLSAVQSKTVMVTGAGGSIGAEICRQAAAAGTAKLVLFEISEPALYAIEQELLHAFCGKVEIVPVLGSVCDGRCLQAALRDHGVQTLYHAAAYKQVPMVEANALEGLRNNTLGTHVLALAAEACGVERVMLVSTDKAVRPTSVMGASKRLAELAFLLANEHSRRTIFSMVRFGNVMGSSSSVIPNFKKQIAAGGPVTVTHPEVIRYFMTIPEAAQLVVQASSMAGGGDVFLLDMGEPVAILDLARQMIHLSGLEVKHESNPGGDIAIQFTGLRPGEKLFEELLVSADQLPTVHPKIMRAMDASVPAQTISLAIAELERAIERHDLVAAMAVARKMVEGYARQVSRVAA